MMQCYYCESNPAVTTKFNQPACEVCNQKEVRTIAPFYEMSEEDKAEMLKHSLMLIETMKKRGRQAKKRDNKL